MATVTFLGTGNFLAPGRYWNSFVLDGRILVEPAPTALPHLRRCGVPLENIDVVAISHFHPDHTFGWPFVLLEALGRGRSKPLYVVGPPDVAAFLADMMELGGVASVHEQAHSALDIEYVEVDGSGGWQRAGDVRFRGIEVEHVPHLRCFGFLFERDGRVVGYSGDTRPCRGLDELAAGADALILECNGPHPPPETHMDVAGVRALRSRFPGVPFLLTHVGFTIDGAAVADIADASVPDDFDVVEV